MARLSKQEKIELVTSWIVKHGASEVSGCLHDPLYHPMLRAGLLAINCHYFIKGKTTHYYIDDTMKDVLSGLKAKLSDKAKKLVGLTCEE